MTVQSTSVPTAAKSSSFGRLDSKNLILIPPGIMLLVFFLCPFLIMGAVSFYYRVPDGFYEPDFVLSNYAAFFDPVFLTALVRSLTLCAVISVVCVSLAMPFTYLVSRMRRVVQIPIVILLLCILTLSEVILGFSWTILLSRTAGVSNILVWLGVLDRPVSLYPSSFAIMIAMLHFCFPFAVLTIYPPISRFDRSLPEAAATMGAGPVRAFFTVVVPALRGTIISALVLVFVFALGAYLFPQMLGRPADWTLSVLITDQAIYKSNIPFAAAMSVFLCLICFSLILGVGKLSKKSEG
ncbi:ABC transporter permease [uncultured Ruegeria sp.]|uniref:ABC transporter permease n=1 Tax=uncultured Ruegeria sp. TaxID=259304 RepID=UPI0026273B41|nr:ABC transporter permease [uncultured Ruegeria sp.]